jgi:cytochrome c556
VRTICLSLVMTTLVWSAEPSFQLVGSTSQLMISIIYPASNAIFYIHRGAPKDDKEWAAMQANALMMAEAGNLLMMGNRAKDQDNWIKDAKLLVEVGAAAFKAAQAKDADALDALSEQLNTACVTCHQDYRPRRQRK